MYKLVGAGEEPPKLAEHHSNDRHYSFSPVIDLALLFSLIWTSCHVVPLVSIRILLYLMSEV